MVAAIVLAAMMTPFGEKVTAENAWREYPRPQMVRADWQLSYDMFPPEVEAAIAAYAAKGGKVYSWGASVRHLPKGGIACRSAYDAYARLKAGK